MARISVRDYFSKYSFDDGDHEEMVNYARSIANGILRLLNSEFEERGLPQRVVLNEVATAHNPVRMTVVWEAAETGYTMWDAQGMHRKVNPDLLQLRQGYQAYVVDEKGCPPEIDGVLRAVQQKIERMDDMDLR